MQGQVLHTPTERKIRLPLIFTRLSDEQKQEFLYSKNIFLTKKSKEQQS